MLRISFRTEPFWLDLPHGVRLQVRPPGTAVILAAGAELAAGPSTSLGTSPVANSGAKRAADHAADAPAAGPDPEIAARPPASPTSDALSDSRRLAFTSAVARAAILDWTGVADAEGAPLPVSLTAIDALMEIWPVFAAFERLYLQPALLVVAEGNG